jgi:sulfate permease, SulP family
LPLFGFAAFGSSRYLVVSADSATAAIFAGGVASLAPPSSARYVALAGAVALLTAGFLLLARLLKLGFIADFLSETVLAGFLTGVGSQVGIAVLGEMLGVSVSAHRTIPQLAEVCGRLPDVHPPTLASNDLTRCPSLNWQACPKAVTDTHIVVDTEKGNFKSFTLKGLLQLRFN